MKYGELRRPAIQAIDKEKTVVVVPLGSLEQHGQHLPLLTDSLLGGAVAERAEGLLGDGFLFLPMQWLGASDHHLKFPGTVTVSSALYIEMVCSIIESLLSAGFKRVFLLVSHGGNVVPCQEAIYRIAIKHRERDDLWVGSCAYWTLASDVMKIPEMETAQLTHACEYETSMVLALHPQLVDMSQAKGVTAWIESRFYHPDHTSEKRSKVDVSLPFERMTTTGAMGRPDLATAEKGEKLLEFISARVAEFLREFAQWGKLRLE